MQGKLTVACPPRSHRDFRNREAGFAARRVGVDDFRAVTATSGIVRRRNGQRRIPWSGWRAVTATSGIVRREILFFCCGCPSKRAVTATSGIVRR